jgi:putative sterol carrier protein
MNTLLEYFKSLETKLTVAELEGISTQINFELGEKDYHLKVQDQKISYAEGKLEDAEINIKSSESDLLDIIKGETNPMMAMMLGKIKISNPGAMMKYAKLLGLM